VNAEGSAAKTALSSGNRNKSGYTVTGMRHYRKVGIASTFSPSHKAVLAEAFRFVDVLGAEAVLLHAADGTEAAEARFLASLHELGRDASRKYVPGPDPCAAITGAAGALGLDLLVAGALERQPHSHERSFTGSVASRLLGESPCDVLLLPRAQEEPPRIERAFFAVEPGQDPGAFIPATVRLLGLRQIIVGVAETPFAAALALSRGEEPVDLQQWVDDMAGNLGVGDVEVETRVVDSNTGFGLCDAARAMEAQLMVVHAPRKRGHTILPNHLDWMRQVIPTRLLLCGTEGRQEVKG
jgi:nucleotide-binding universal stress UspA family protein